MLAATGHHDAEQRVEPFARHLGPVRVVTLEPRLGDVLARVLDDGCAPAFQVLGHGEDLVVHLRNRNDGAPRHQHDATRCAGLPNDEYGMITRSRDVKR